MAKTFEVRVSVPTDQIRQTEDCAGTWWAWVPWPTCLGNLGVWALHVYMMVLKIEEGLHEEYDEMRLNNLVTYLTDILL